MNTDSVPSVIFGKDFDGKMMFVFKQEKKRKMCDRFSKS